MSDIKDVRSIGPLQLLVVGFDKPNFKGRILDEINTLRKNKVIRVVDAIAVQKRKDGTIDSVEVSDLPKDEAAQYGAVIGYFIGLGSGDKKIAKETARKAAESAADEYEYGMRAEDFSTILADVQEGSAALMLLIEHLWALPLRRAMRDAGGIIIAQDFLSPEALISMGQSMYAEAK